MNWWGYLIISSSVVHFFCFQFFPGPGSFPMSWLLCTEWPKHSCISISPYNEYSGLISFRIDWFDLPAGQWTLKSLLQHQNSKASILWHSVFFIVQLSYPYWLLEKSQFWLYGPLSAKWCLFFLINCYVCHNFPSKEQSSFNFMVIVTIILEPKKIQSVTASLFPLPFTIKW